MDICCFISSSGVIFGDLVRYVLAAGAIAGALHYWSNLDGHLMFHLVVAGLMASQLAEYMSWRSPCSGH